MFSMRIIFTIEIIHFTNNESYKCRIGWLGGSGISSYPPKRLLINLQ